MALASSLGPRLNLHQSQSLVMTPQLRQAIQLLQFSNIEANHFVEEELLSNPLLERGAEEKDLTPVDKAQILSPRDEPDLCAASGLLPEPADISLDMDTSNVYDFGTNADGYSGSGFTGDDEEWDSIAALAAQPVSLREHLSQQIRLNFSAQKDQIIASRMILALDPSGRLDTTPDALAEAFNVDLTYIEKIRGLMMRFEPVGLFATSLAECLAVQLAEKNRLDPAMQALLENLDLLAKREFKTLQTLCGVDAEDLMDMIAELKRLDPKPGARYQSEVPLRPLIPDVLMRPAPNVIDGSSDWFLELNPETMPRLLIRHGFYVRLLASTGKESRSFLSEQMQRASWLVKALEARAQTILKVSAEIIRRQEAFFRHGILHLQPLTLRDVAIEVGLHESTVSRVTSNKSIATPRGIFDLKFFFTTALVGESGQAHSAEAVRYRVEQLISAENPKNILSDDAIAVLLQKEGIDIARRTVAKYREALRIPGSAQRRRNKNTA